MALTIARSNSFRFLTMEHMKTLIYWDLFTTDSNIVTRLHTSWCVYFCAHHIAAVCEVSYAWLDIRGWYFQHLRPQTIQMPAFMFPIKFFITLDIIILYRQTPSKWTKSRFYTITKFIAHSPINTIYTYWQLTTVFSFLFSPQVQNAVSSPSFVSNICIALSLTCPPA